VKRASLPEDVALIIGTIPRERVVLAQTPQAFATKLIKEAFARAQSGSLRLPLLYSGIEAGSALPSRIVPHP